MTNFEWIKNDDKMLKDALTYSLAVHKSTRIVAKCRSLDMSCCDCLFGGKVDKECSDLRRAWLEEEYQPLYKNGDIILGASGYLYFVISEQCNNILVNDKFDGFNVSAGFFINKDSVKQKIGNIFDNCDDKEVNNYESL